MSTASDWSRLITADPVQTALFFVVALMLVLLIVLVAAVVLYLIILVVGLMIRFLRRTFIGSLPAGISPFVLTWPLGTLALGGSVATLTALVLTRGSLNLPVFVAGVGGSLIASSIAGAILAGREATVARIRDSGLVYVWANRMGRVPRNQQAIDWIAEIRKAKTFCTLLGTSLSGYTVHDRRHFERVVQEMIPRIGFKLLLLKPTSGLALLRETEENRVGEKTIPRIWDSIEALIEIKAALDERYRERFRIFFYDQIPTFAIHWVDGYMIVTHYLPGISNANSPAYALWDLHPFKAQEAQLYDMFEDNMTNLMDRVEEVTLDELRAAVAEYRRAAEPSRPREGHS